MVTSKLDNWTKISRLSKIAFKWKYLLTRDMQLSQLIIDTQLFPSHRYVYKEK
jgi:hypothetical protein